MDNSRSGPSLIKTFFKALEAENLKQCEIALAQLRGVAVDELEFGPWCDYFDGVLANVRDFDWTRAEHIYRRLLQGELELPLRGRVCLGLGLVLEHQGRWSEAIAAHKRSLPIFGQLNQSLDQAKAWKNIASAYEGGFTHGDFGLEALNRAQDCCQQTLAILQIVPDLWLEATTHEILGLIFKHLHRWLEARECYQRSLKLYDILGDKFGIGTAQGNLGEIYQLQQPPDRLQALAAYQQALAVFRRFGNIYHQAETLTNIAYLHHQSSDPAKALDYYEQALALIETLREGQTSETGRAGYFTTVANIYANTVLLYVDRGDVERAFATVERARSRAFLDTLVARAGPPDHANKVEAATLTLTEVQTALPDNTLLIEYFTTGLIEAQDSQTAGQSARRHRFPPPRTLIFAVTCDRFEFHQADISPNDLHPGHFESVVERHFLEAPIRRALYDRLISPVEHLLSGQRRLYVVPHGPLHYIPFQALIAPDGETLLREAGPRLVYAPSATLLFGPKPQPSLPPTASCLAIGYDSRAETRLQFAEAEARSIARLTTGQALVGPAPKKTAIYDQAGAYRLLHLACHGEFDPQTPLASFLHLAPDETLTAQEVLEQLHLRCDLVTLSACESGLSRVRRGDELVGFTRAFMSAGTPALVSTLWRVSDHSTRILMEKFYQAIQTGLDFAEALKQAQLYVKNLSYEEALAILTSPPQEQTDEPMASSFCAPEHPATWPRPGLTLRQAKAYLRGVARRGQLTTEVKISTEPALDEKIFADPYYWAPFILSSQN